MAKNAKIRLRAGENIGSPAAEQDHEYLGACFVAMPLVDTIKDISSHRCLILGRTGAGKSAVLWHLEHTLNNVTRVDPKEASFEYVSNSTIIQYLSDLGVDLHVFYEYLWKHILAVHVIRECLGVRTEHSFRTMLGKIQSFVRRDQRKAAVVAYLESHGGKFWIDADEISKELTRSVSEKLKTEFGAASNLLDGKIGAESNQSDSEKRTIKLRAQEIVSGLQMRELNETISALADLMAEKDEGHYVLIDDLDGNWAGSEITKYALIRSLIECIKSFRRIPNLKIVVALREDLYESMILAATDRHFQPEKFEGLISRIRWTKGSLYQVVEERIARLFAHRYTRSNVRLEHVFPTEVRGEAIRAFLVERTLRRPRDIIALVNKILSSADGADLPLPARAVTSIEASFSRDRFQALAVEWRSSHPNFEVYARAVSGRSTPIRISELNGDRLYELICDVESQDRLAVDDVERLAKQAYEGSKTERLLMLARALVCCLFKSGVVGVKTCAEEPYKYCYDEHATVRDTEIGEDAKIVVHPMVASALGWREDRSIAA